MKKVMMVGVVGLALCAQAGTVHVCGHGSVFVEPDMMRLRFDIRAFDEEDLEKSAELFGVENAKAVQVLKDVGVSSNEVTTSRIEIEPQYHRENKDGEYVCDYTIGKRVFDGWKHSMSYTVEAPLDRERFDRIYRALVKLDSIGGVDVSFFVKDKKSARVEARRLAVKNARALADELSEAAGTTLGSVKEISYAKESYAYNRDICCSAVIPEQAENNDTPIFPVIKIDDIEVSDSVEIIWNLKE